MCVCVVCVVVFINKEANPTQDNQNEVKGASEGGSEGVRKSHGCFTGSKRRVMGTICGWCMLCYESRIHKFALEIDF